MDEILGLPAGTVRADQKLDELENLDSTEIISRIVLAKAHSDVSVLPDPSVTSSKVADLARCATNCVARIADCDASKDHRVNERILHCDPISSCFLDMNSRSVILREAKNPRIWPLQMRRFFGRSAPSE